MKNITHLIKCVALCLVASVAASLASAFDGKIEMKTTVGKETMPMTYYIKGTLMRMEIKPEGGKRKGKDNERVAMILNTTKREMTILMESEKMYMVQTLPPDEGSKNHKGEDIEFKATGRKEKIAGIEAEEFVGISKKQRVEIWVTKELGKFIAANPSGPMGGGKKKAEAWESFADKENLFPLRTITRANKEGAPEESRMEVISIDKSTQPDSLFKPPADYAKFEMPGMGDMMKGMMPGR